MGQENLRFQLFYEARMNIFAGALSSLKKLIIAQFLESLAEIKLHKSLFLEH